MIGITLIHVSKGNPAVLWHIKDNVAVAFGGLHVHRIELINNRGPLFREYEHRNKLADNLKTICSKVASAVNTGVGKQFIPSINKPIKSVHELLLMVAYTISNII